MHFSDYYPTSLLLFLQAENACNAPLWSTMCAQGTDSLWLQELGGSLLQPLTWSQWNFLSFESGSAAHGLWQSELGSKCFASPSLNQA